jgi:hypothetical protein
VAHTLRFIPRRFSLPTLLFCAAKWARYRKYGSATLAPCLRNGHPASHRITNQ